MPRKSIKAEECISALNSWKESVVKVCRLRENYALTKANFFIGWKSCGLPCGQNVWRAIMHFKIIASVGKDAYRFTDDGPIYVGKLMGILNWYRSQSKEQQARSSRALKGSSVNAEPESEIKVDPKPEKATPKVEVKPSEDGITEIVLRLNNPKGKIVIELTF